MSDVSAISINQELGMGDHFEESASYMDMIWKESINLLILSCVLLSRRQDLQNILSWRRPTKIINSALK